jgi:hypothetical protein
MLVTLKRKDNQLLNSNALAKKHNRLGINYDHLRNEHDNLFQEHIKLLEWIQPTIKNLMEGTTPKQPLIIRRKGAPNHYKSTTLKNII